MHTTQVMAVVEGHQVKAWQINALI